MGGFFPPRQEKQLAGWHGLPFYGFDWATIVNKVGIACQQNDLAESDEILEFRHRMSSSQRSINNSGVHFGEWLRQLRLDRALRLRSVAAAADMDQAHLSKIELGQRLPTEEQTVKLAKFFGLNETETEARRIVEKFRQEHSENPKAAREAVHILAEAQGFYSAGPKPKLKK